MKIIIKMYKNDYLNKIGGRRFQLVQLVKFLMVV